MDLKEVKIFSDAFKRFYDIVQSEKSMNDCIPTVMFSEKLVFYNEDKTKIYRIENPRGMDQRLRLIRYAKTQGIDLFLDETKIEEYCSDILWVSEQPIISLDPLRKPDAVLFETFTDKEKDFFRKFQIAGFGRKNYGYDENGKLKIFDWFGNYSVYHNELYIDGKEI